MHVVRADFIDDGEQLQADWAMRIDDAGRIAELGDAERLTAAHPELEVDDLSGFVLTAGCVNAHSHCFQVLMRGAADQPRDFEDWVSRHLYPTVSRLDAHQLEAAATLAFAQMVKAGTTSLGEFHYVHNDASGASQPELDTTVVEAARRVGLRISLVRCFYDQSTRPGQQRFSESPSQAVNSTRALAELFADDPLVNVLPAPHSLHGASAEMIQCAAELAAELDTPYHIHLAEQRSDLAASERRYGVSPLRALDKLGVFSPRTVLVHGLWLDPEERQMLAESGGGLVYNPHTNMALGDGILALPELLERGVRVGLGTDANTTLSLFHEMRMAEYLQRVTRLQMGIVANLEVPGAGSARPLLRAGTEDGAALLGTDAGRLAPGRPADFLAIDREAPSLLPSGLHGGEALLNALVSAMVPERAVRRVYVAGGLVARDGELLALSDAELADMLRRAEL